MPPPLRSSQRPLRVHHRPQPRRASACTAATLAYVVLPLLVLINMAEPKVDGRDVGSSASPLSRLQTTDHDPGQERDVPVASTVPSDHNTVLIDETPSNNPHTREDHAQPAENTHSNTPTQIPATMTPTSFIGLSRTHPTIVRNAANDAWVELRCMRCGGNAYTNSPEDFIAGVLEMREHVSRDHPRAHSSPYDYTVATVVEQCTVDTWTDEEAQEILAWTPADGERFVEVQQVKSEGSAGRLESEQRKFAPVLGDRVEFIDIDFPRGGSPQLGSGAGAKRSAETVGLDECSDSETDDDYDHGHDEDEDTVDRDHDQRWIKIWRGHWNRELAEQALDRVAAAWQAEQNAIAEERPTADTRSTLGQPLTIDQLSITNQHSTTIPRTTANQQSTSPKHSTGANQLRKQVLTKAVRKSTPTLGGPVNVETAHGGVSITNKRLKTNTSSSVSARQASIANQPSVNKNRNTGASTKPKRTVNLSSSNRTSSVSPTTTQPPPASKKQRLTLGSKAARKSAPTYGTQLPFKAARKSAPTYGSIPPLVNAGATTDESAATTTTRTLDDGVTTGTSSVTANEVEDENENAAARGGSTTPDSIEAERGDSDPDDRVASTIDYVSDREESYNFVADTEDEGEEEAVESMLKVSRGL